MSLLKNQEFSTGVTSARERSVAATVIVGNSLLGMPR